MGYVKVKQEVFKLERLGCVVFIFSLFLGNFTFLRDFMEILQYAVALIFVLTNIFFLINLNLPGNNTSEKSKEEQLKQMQESMDKLKMEQQQELMKWEKQIVYLKREMNQKIEKCEEENQKLMEDLEEERARHEEYTSEINYQRKLSKLEERLDKLEEQREEPMKDAVKEEDSEKLKEKCNKLEEEKEELLKVVEELKSYQQLCEAERNSLMCLLDSQINVTKEYKELVNKQNDIMLKVSNPRKRERDGC